MKKTLRIYRDTNGKQPYLQWLSKLKDVKAADSITARLERLVDGSYGNHRYLGNGIAELKFNMGPGYRIYFGEDGDTIVLLLCAGDKSSQKKDIKQAKLYWERYLNYDK